MDALRAIATPDVEVGAEPELPNSGTYTGHEGFLTWVAQWLDAWDEFHIEVVDMTAVDDRHVLVAVNQHGRGASSGVEVTMRDRAYLVTIRGDRIAGLRLYADRASALAAVRGPAAI